MFSFSRVCNAFLLIRNAAFIPHYQITSNSSRLKDRGAQFSVGVGRGPRLHAVTSRLVDLQPVQTLEHKNQFVSATLTAAG